MPWHVSATDHAAFLSEFLFRELVDVFPLCSRRMRASFISEPTARMHRYIAQLRHALRNRSEALRLALLRCAFLAWGSAAEGFSSVFTGPWLRQLRAAIALIGLAGKDLRRLCRQDKRQHLERLTDEVEAAPAQETQVALKRLLRPKKFRRGGPAPLPFLKSSVRTDRFAALLVRCRRNADDTSLSLKEVLRFCQPRLHAIARNGKRPSQFVKGFAAPPSRTWTSCARFVVMSALSKQLDPMGFRPLFVVPLRRRLRAVFWPLAMKVLCFGAEPLGYKGGTLYHIAKPGAPRGTCNSERGVLVQSTLEKVLHKALRPVAVRQMERMARPMQIGESHTMGFYCTRLFLDVGPLHADPLGLA